MSNESAPECLKHKDNRNVQVRLDYMLLYQSEVKAKIIRILETWTSHKYAEWYKSTADAKEQGIEPSVEDLWVTMSYEQLTIFVYGTAQHDTIKQYVDELVASGDIKRRPHPEIPYGPPQYLLNRKKVQDGLDALEIPPNLFDLSPLFLSPRKKRTPLEKYPPGGGINTPRVGGNLPLGRGENTHPSNKHTKNHLEITKKKERALVAASSQSNETHAHAFTEDDYHFYGTKRQHLIWNCHNWCAGQHGTCEDYVAAIENGWQEAETGKQAAVKIGASNGTRPPADHHTMLSDQRGHQDSGHPAQAVVSASIPGRAASPQAAADPHSLQGPQDGATTGVEAGEPRASGERNVPLSAHEAEMKAWLEEVRATELDLDARDVTAIRCLATKKGTDDKEMFLNIVAVLDSDPWFEEHHVSVDFYWINRQWNNKYMFLQRKKPAHPPNGQKTIGGYAWFGEV